MVGRSSFVVPVLVKRALELESLWSFRLSLAVQRIPTIEIADLIAKSRQVRKERQCLYLGRGFSWGQRHAEIAVQLNNRNVEEIPDVPAIVKRGIEWANSVPPHQRTPTQKAAAYLAQRILPANTKPVNDSDIGLPWIHGIGVEQEQELGIPLSALTGHTLITGTTRAGKTRLFELLTTQLIDMGSCLIVIDPKKMVIGSSACGASAREQGVSFSTLTRPARPSRSASIRWPTGTA
ncbi:hypothetical protein LP417_35310 (plasmid) [Polaromonas sp. P1-6]|nr:hypothetical protein LP417_35310 [Polaromonas sp. P1-6]